MVGRPGYGNMGMGAHGQGPFGGLGAGDLDPLGAQGGMGGMLLDPRGLMGGQMGGQMGGRGGLPGHPALPGARFDPVFPHGGPGPGRQGGPDFDGMRPPGFDDDHGMFG